MRREGARRMTLEELLQIYPHAVRQTPLDTQKWLALTVDNQELWLQKSLLTATEQHLLQHLFQVNTVPILGKEHPWYHSLFQHKPAPSKEGRYRIIQVTFNQQKNVSIDAWKHEIKNMLPQIVDHFFISEHQCLLIEAFSDYALSFDDLAGLFLALDGDFDTYSRVFIGSFYPYHCDFTQLLDEERDLFQQAMTIDNQRQCFMLSDSVVQYFAAHAAKDSYLMQQLALSWFDEEMAILVQTLWQHQGNISSAAKALFLHRNTLQYKIEKFQKQTMTNLKQMDHLFLCYLLVIGFDLL